MPEIAVLHDMEFDDPELEPIILPVDARLSLRGSVADFREIFERLAAVSPQKEIVSGTSSILVAIEDLDSDVHFTATNGEQTLCILSRKLRVLRAGRALLPAHKIVKILALAPEDQIVLTVLANTATITSGRAIWNILTPVGERMAPIPEVTDVELVKVPRIPLLKGLTTVRRALPVTGSRQSLMQARIESGTVTTADGARLLRYRLQGFPKDLSLSIPAKAIDELLRGLRSSDSTTVSIGANHDYIVVRIDDDIFISNRLMLSFPDVDSMLIAPALENKNLLTVDVSELRDVIKRVRVSADPDYATVVLHFAKTKGAEREITVLTRDRSGNSASEKLFGFWEGSTEAFEMTLNHKHLLDLLDSAMDRVVSLKIGTDVKMRLTPLFLQDEVNGLVGLVQQSSSK